MLTSIDTYFQAERAESLLFAAFGVTAIALALYLLWRYGGALAMGLAVPLVLVGLIQIVVGGTVLLRTSAQAVALKAQYVQAPARFKADETPRMVQVMANFKTYKWIEVAFVIIGLALTVLVSQPFWLGIGMGMLVQGALMLPADITAERRGVEYQAAIARGV